MSNEKMRNEFRAAYEKAFDTCPRGYIVETGEYTNDHAAAAWWAWQASRAALCVELPKIVNSEWACTSDECSAMRDAIRFCKRAIESTGVRTR